LTSENIFFIPIIKDKIGSDDVFNKVEINVLTQNIPSFKNLECLIRNPVINGKATEFLSNENANRLIGSRAKGRKASNPCNIFQYAYIELDHAGDIDYVAKVDNKSFRGK
jgi:hypothetical protein